MAELPHRDIYVGMVAEDLAKEGYFGTEVYRYYYLTGEGENRILQEFKDEIPCVLNMLKDIRKKIPVTDYIMLRKRLYDASESDVWLKEVQEEAKSILFQKNTIASCISALIPPKEDAIIPNAEEIADNEKILSGFLWEEKEGQLQRYSNAYLPSTWKKWIEKQEKGVAVGEIVCGVYTVDNQHPLYLAQEDFKGKLV